MTKASSASVTTRYPGLAQDGGLDSAMTPQSLDHYGFCHGYTHHGDATHGDTTHSVASHSIFHSLPVLSPPDALISPGNVGPRSRRRRRQGRQRLPLWARLSLLLNIALGMGWVLQGQPSSSWGNLIPGDSLIPGLTESSASSPAIAPEQLLAQAPLPLDTDPMPPGQRHKLPYEGWVQILRQEAVAMANQAPEDLSILAGDSISLWFPETLLPQGQTWLNQGISGDTSEGLINRMPAWQGLQPKRIFILIGINDLLKGATPTQVLDNQRKIVQQLKRTHPRSTIVVQSILPHRGESASWEGRSRLARIPNDHIRSLNRSLAAMTTQEGVLYLNINPLFSDPSGYLRKELTTDGLHLNPQGYLVWSTALTLFEQQLGQRSPLTPPPPVTPSYPAAAHSDRSPIPNNSPRD